MSEEISNHSKAEEQKKETKSSKTPSRERIGHIKRKRRKK